MKRKTNTSRVGFTLVELLTTLAVIGILLGLLIPALNMVGKTATKVKQKAQFHAIGTALEAFRNDYGDYPPSEWDNDATDGNGVYYGNYSAAKQDKVNRIREMELLCFILVVDNSLRIWAWRVDSFLMWLTITIKRGSHIRHSSCQGGQERTCKPGTAYHVGRMPL